LCSFCWRIWWMVTGELQGVVVFDTYQLLQPFLDCLFFVGQDKKSYSSKPVPPKLSNFGQARNRELLYSTSSCGNWTA
jgi:hypothetical protein